MYQGEQNYTLRAVVCHSWTQAGGAQRQETRLPNILKYAKIAASLYIHSYAFKWVGQCCRYRTRHQRCQQRVGSLIYLLGVHPLMMHI